MVDVSPESLEFITKDVPFVMLASGTDKWPSVPPVVFRVINIFEDDVTAVVLTVTVPATKVDVPRLALLPVAILILFPAASKAMFPVISTLSVGAVVAPNPVAPTKLFVVDDPG